MATERMDMSVRGVRGRGKVRKRVQASGKKEDGSYQIGGGDLERQGVKPQKRCEGLRECAMEQKG
jgi:hypothetical protein